MYDDPRYDAVGSASLREELFNTFVKGSITAATQQQDFVQDRSEGPGELDEDKIKQRQKEKKERAVKEREQKVRVERDRLEVDIGRSRMDINKEEGERTFKCADYFCLTRPVTVALISYLFYFQEFIN